MPDSTKQRSRFKPVVQTISRHRIGKHLQQSGVGNLQQPQSADGLWQGADVHHGLNEDLQGLDFPFEHPHLIVRVSKQTSAKKAQCPAERTHDSSQIVRYLFLFRRAVSTASIGR